MDGLRNSISFLLTVEDPFQGTKCWLDYLLSIVLEVSLSVRTPQSSPQAVLTLSTGYPQPHVLPSEGHCSSMKYLQRSSLLFGKSTAGLLKISMNDE